MVYICRNMLFFLNTKMVNRGKVSYDFFGSIVNGLAIHDQVRGLAKKIYRTQAYSRVRESEQMNYNQMSAQFQADTLRGILVPAKQKEFNEF